MTKILYHGMINFTSHKNTMKNSLYMIKHKTSIIDSFWIIQ